MYILFSKFYLTKTKNLCIIKIRNEKPQSGLPRIKCLNTSNSPKFTDVFFYWSICSYSKLQLML